MFFIVQWKPWISSCNQEKSFLTEFDLIWFDLATLVMVFIIVGGLYF